MEKADVIIIGAGAAGLMAAKELCAAGRSVLILEGDNRIGGRIYTLDDAGFPGPAELGAEFVHGKLPLTMSLLKEANLSYRPIKARYFRFAKGRFLPEEDTFPGWEKMQQKAFSMEEDIALQDFLDTYFSGSRNAPLRQAAINYAAGYDTADAEDASTVELFKEWEEGDEEQYRIEGGYTALVAYLKEVCIAGGCRIVAADAVTQISREKGRVLAYTAAGKEYSADQLIVTVPVGMLRNEKLIRFEPEIPSIRKTADQIGFGSVVKIVMRFTSAFWQSIKPADHTIFILSDRKIPTWWTCDDEPVITGWAGGKYAGQLKGKDKKEITDIAVRVLAVIFHEKPSGIRGMLADIHFRDWASERFTMGSYSYPKAGRAGLKELKYIGIENTVYFAGEAYVGGRISGTVEAALVSGREVARGILDLNV